MYFRKCAATVLIVAIIFSNVFSVIAEEKTINNMNHDDFVIVKSDDEYANYLNSYKDIQTSSQDITIPVNCVLGKEGSLHKINVSSDGLYAFGLSYKAADDGVSAFEVSLMIDGKYHYALSKELSFPRMWKDESEIRFDDNGNQFSPTQIQVDEFCYNVATNNDSDYNDSLKFFLSSGEHDIKISVTNGKMDVEYLKFASIEKISKYIAPDVKEIYQGSPIVIEAEKAYLKSDRFLVAKTDNTTNYITPNSAFNSILNYIGGGNWSNMGDTITWKTGKLKAGYYCIEFVYQQNSQIGGKTYRSLKIDGKTPFVEAENIGFSYDEKWQNYTFSDNSNNPYYVYFSEGEHTISLTVTAGQMAEIRSELSEAISMTGDLYLDINMITGETVDIYRDYDLFSQIKDMEERLKKIRSLLQKSADDLLRVTGSKSGSNYSVIMNLVEVIDQMLTNQYDSHKYKSYFYSNYCSVSSVLQDLKNMPLSLDKIVLFSPKNEYENEQYSFFKNIFFSAKRFLYSFTEDYEVNNNTNDSITVWVNWGRDQAQVLDSLVKRSFTSKTGINVNVKLTNASVVQAELSGAGPDCILEQTRSQPVNLAMRGVLYDLSSFKDCDKVLKRFQNNAELPYKYKGSLYALPDTQTYFMMFYRKDVLQDLGLSIPNTWDDLKMVAKLLYRNNLNVWLPNNTIIDNNQINHGIGSVNIFPSLLLQNGISIYSEDGKSTNLALSDVSNIFSDWTSFYNEMKFPKTMDFYNRFRTGTTPLGIAPYTLYTTLTVAAPEISGQWGMTAIPGTLQSNGTIDHTSSGGGSGCCILKSTKEPEKSWEFLKWWTDEDTQLTFSNDIESILGPAGRVALANVNAIKNLTWEDDMLDDILNAWNSVEEIPEYPGSYYVSRSVYQAFWNVVEKNKNPKEMLIKYGKEADVEIVRKWEQYSDR